VNGAPVTFLLVPRGKEVNLPNVPDINLSGLRHAVALIATTVV
jgi:hypothetical protein